MSVSDSVMKIRKIHKYVSLAISVQLLLWTISGLYFSFNKIESIRGEHYYRTVDENLIDKKERLIEKISENEAFSIITDKTFLQPLSMELISESEKGSEYRGKDLPIYKVTALDIKGDYVNIYQDVYSGDIIALRTQSWNIWDFMWGLHIMDWVERDNINNIFLKFFSFLALITSISGILLFFFRRA